jgi:segregation and condensation protein B
LLLDSDAGSPGSEGASGREGEGASSAGDASAEAETVALEGEGASSAGDASVTPESEGARGRAGEGASPAGDAVAEAETVALEGEGASSAGDASAEAEAVTPESEGRAGEDADSADLLAAVERPSEVSSEDSQFKALLEAIVYITEEPLSLAQIAAALGQPRERVQKLLDELVADFDRPEHGVTIREVAGGYKMTTKAEHHETVRSFVKSLKPPLKLSLPALETLAVIAYKQPVTAPEIMEIRGVQGAGVLKTLLDRKLIAAAGRKNVIGKPILYKTTKEFLVQFGLKDLNELPSLKEFEEIRRMAIDGDTTEPPPANES